MVPIDKHGNIIRQSYIIRSSKFPEYGEWIVTRVFPDGSVDLRNSKTGSPEIFITPPSSNGK